MTHLLHLRKCIANSIVRTYPLINISTNHSTNFSHKNDIFDMFYKERELLLFSEDSFFSPVRSIMENILRREFYSYSIVKFPLNHNCLSTRYNYNINNDINNLIPLKYILFFNDIYKLNSNIKNNKKNIFREENDLFKITASHNKYLEDIILKKIGDIPDDYLIKINKLIIDSVDAKYSLDGLLTIKKHYTGYNWQDKTINDIRFHNYYSNINDNNIIIYNTGYNFTTDGSYDIILPLQNDPFYKFMNDVQNVSEIKKLDQRQQNVIRYPRLYTQNNKEKIFRNNTYVYKSIGLIHTREMILLNELLRASGWNTEFKFSPNI